MLVIATSLIEFSSLVSGGNTALTGHHVLHVVTSVVGPILIASLTLLTVHSAAREAAAGTVDHLVVQNVTFTLEVALLVLLAFAFRRNRKVHGALLLSTALMFLVIAVFFTFISYVPGYRIEEPETFDRFAKSAQTGALIGGVIGLAFFLRGRRTGGPWRLVTGFFFLNGYTQFAVAQSGRTQALSVLAGFIGEVPAFLLGLSVGALLLWMVWTRRPAGA